MLSDAFAVWVGRQDGLSTFSGHISARDVNAKQGIHRSWWLKPWKSDCCLGWWSPSRGFIRTQISWPPHNCRNMKVTHLPRPIQKGFHPETCLIFQKAFNPLKKINCTQQATIGHLSLRFSAFFSANTITIIWETQFIAPRVWTVPSEDHWDISGI